MAMARGLRTGGVVAGGLLLCVGLALAVVVWRRLLDESGDGVATADDINGDDSSDSRSQHSRETDPLVVPRDTVNLYS